MTLPLITRIKLLNKYDLVVDSLYKDVIPPDDTENNTPNDEPAETPANPDEEQKEEEINTLSDDEQNEQDENNPENPDNEEENNAPQEPENIYKKQAITDVEGTTALLTTDGTSWEFTNDDWQRIDENIDHIILFGIYPFLMSICNSIHNNFVKCCMSKIFDNLTFVKNEVDETVIEINGFEELPNLVAGDFILVKTCYNEFLTTVIDVIEQDGNEDEEIAPIKQIKIDGKGLDIRITGKPERVGIFYVSFPPQFLNTAIQMFAFDLFTREDKEKRQERLGNYTYTNFEPTTYYGEGSYPKDMEEAIKYFQQIHL